jgi:tetratricopeptide (TPR) repeat protein
MKTIAKIITLIILVGTIGCKKDFLDAKPDDSLIVPESLNDMQQILDNDMVMNGGKNVSGADPSLGNSSADDYYVPDEGYDQLDDFAKAVYTWAKVIPWPVSNHNWVGPYRSIYYANTVLAGLQKITPMASEQVTYNSIKGSALFYRSYQFFNLSQVFAPPYDASRLASDPGIPLRLSPEFTERSVRASLKETYDRIISDLRESLSLLPNKPLMQTRPSRPAAFGLLARVYLTMHDFEKSLAYCDSALTINSALLDYNKIDIAQSIPFSVLNEEVVFQASIAPANGYISYGRPTKVDTTLISMYSDNDLRKNLFFNNLTGGMEIKGTYSGTIIPFSGIANDELFLMQAECYARLNNPGTAMMSLNELLKYRYTTSSFVPETAASGADALDKVLVERRKELVMRNLRWMDLRRLNKEGRNITISRNVRGTVYTLPPNDVKYTWPIPDEVIGLTGMQQNPR